MFPFLCKGKQQPFLEISYFPSRNPFVGISSPERQHLSKRCNARCRGMINELRRKLVPRRINLALIYSWSTQRLTPYSLIIHSDQGESWHKRSMLTAVHSCRISWLMTFSAWYDANVEHECHVKRFAICYLWYSYRGFLIYAKMCELLKNVD